MEIKQSSYLAVMSSDKAFMLRLIDWLNDQKCKPKSTVIRIHDCDPYEELDLRIAQIEGMTVRIQDLEKEINKISSHLSANHTQ